MPYPTPRSPLLDTPSLRRLIVAGGVTLAALAGYIDVVTLGAFDAPASHVTGTLSRIGIDLAAGRLSDVIPLLALVSCFLLGAAVSGAIIGSGQLLPGRRYGVALLVEGAALLAATGLLQAGRFSGVAVAAVACGVQNGMASSYYGLVLRTTHMTGIVTDLGMLLGQRLRGASVEVWKPLLLVGLALGFLGGGVVGQLMYASIGNRSLAVPAAGALLGGSAYLVWRLKAGSGNAAGRSERDHTERVP